MQVLGNSAQLVVVPAALQEERAAEQGDRDAGAAGAELLGERARIVVGRALGHQLPAAGEHGGELAVEQGALDERARRQGLGDADVVVDVRVAVGVARRGHGAGLGRGRNRTSGSIGAGGAAATEASTASRAVISASPKMARRVSRPTRYSVGAPGASAQS